MEWPVMKLRSSAWLAARKSGTEAADGGLVESSGRIAVEGDNAVTDCVLWGESDVSGREKRLMMAWLSRLSGLERGRKKVADDGALFSAVIVCAGQRKPLLLWLEKWRSVDSQE